MATKDQNRAGNMASSKGGESADVQHGDLPSAPTVRSREPLAAEEHSDAYRNLAFVVACVGVLGTGLAFIVLLATEWNNPLWPTVAFAHAQVTIGLPAAALFAFIIVALFRTTEGKIRFRVLALDFEGASGPIVMWILCFLSIILGIKTLW